MRLRRMIKQKARAALRGSRGSAVVLLIICLGVTAVINVVDAAALRMLGYEFTMQSMDIYTYSNNFFYNLPAMLVSLCTWIVRLVLVVPLGYGILNWHLELTDRRKQGVMYIFWPYESRAALRGILVSLNAFVKTALVGCLLLVLPAAILLAGDMPGMGDALSMTLIYSGMVLVAAALLLMWAFVQRFAIAPILLGEKYQLTAHQAIKTSVRFTKGHLFELLRFELSFLPWLLPVIAASAMAAFSLLYDEYTAMPLVWVTVLFIVAITTYFVLTPYYTMAYVMYARYLYEYGLWQEERKGPTPNPTQSSVEDRVVAEPAAVEPAEPAAIPEETAGPEAAEQPATEPYSPQETPEQTEVSASDGQPPSDYL